MRRSKLAAPSPFFEQQIDALREAARLGPVVDLASGRGRHALASASAGLSTIAVDHHAGFLRELEERAREARLPLSTVRFDLEQGPEPPLAPGRCGAVLVFRFLHRPLSASIERLIAPGGVLLYETFTIGQRALAGGPQNPDFLLKPDELPGLFPGLDLLHYDEGPREHEVTARLFARRPRDGR